MLIALAIIRRVVEANLAALKCQGAFSGVVNIEEHLQSTQATAPRLPYVHCRF